MQPIKDCKWEVQIYYGAFEKFYNWRISISMWGKKQAEVFLEHIGVFKSERSAKRNWERFAKINGIKKWKYVQD